VKDENTHNTV